MSCGTEVGNPAESSNTSFTTQTTLVAQKVCKKLVECFSGSLTQESCISGIYNVDGFDNQLGLGTSSYDKLSEIINAESSSLISANSSKSSQCLIDIENLTCSSSEVTSAYSSSSANNYDNTYLIIPSNANSCNDMF